VVVLCALEALVACAMLGLMCLGGSLLFRAADYLPLSQRSFLVAMLVVGYFSLFAAFGMYTGRAWGWWLGAFLYSLIAGVHAKLIGQMAASDLADQLPLAELQLDYALQIAPMAFCLIVVVYLCQEHVREFYRLDDRSAWRDAGLLTVAVSISVGGLALGGSLLT